MIVGSAFVRLPARRPDAGRAECGRPALAPRAGRGRPGRRPAAGLSGPAGQVRAEPRARTAPTLPSVAPCGQGTSPDATAAVLGRGDVLPERLRNALRTWAWPHERSRHGPSERRNRVHRAVQRSLDDPHGRTGGRRSTQRHPSGGRGLRLHALPVSARGAEPTSARCVRWLAGPRQQVECSSCRSPPAGHRRRSAQYLARSTPRSWPTAPLRRSARRTAPVTAAPARTTQTGARKPCPSAATSRRGSGSGTPSDLRATYIRRPGGVTRPRTMPPAQDVGPRTARLSQPQQLAMTTALARVGRWKDRRRAGRRLLKISEYPTTPYGRCRRTEPSSAAGVVTQSDQSGNGLSACWRTRCGGYWCSLSRYDDPPTDLSGAYSIQSRSSSVKWVIAGAVDRLRCFGGGGTISAAGRLRHSPRSHEHLLAGAGVMGGASSPRLPPGDGRATRRRADARTTAGARTRETGLNEARARSADSRASRGGRRN